MPSIGRLYTCFTKWLKFRKTFFKERNTDIRKTCKFSWYNPDKDKSPQEFDKKRFDTEECEQEYLRMLNGEGLVGDMASVRFQYSSVEACERAFLLRHTTVPTLLVHAYTENVIETNDLYDIAMTHKASFLVDTAKKQNEALLD